MDGILPKSLDNMDYRESAQGFLTEVTPPDTSVKTKVALAVSVVLLGAAAYYGYRLATKQPQPVTSDDTKKA